VQAFGSGVATVAVDVAVAAIVGWFVVVEVHHHEGVHSYLFVACEVVFGGCGDAGCCGCGGCVVVCAA